MITKKTFLVIDRAKEKKVSRTLRINEIRNIYRYFLTILAVLFFPLGLLLVGYRELLFKINDHHNPNKCVRYRFDSDRKAIFLFAPVDWNFRHQRPQNLAQNLTYLGFKVFYFNPTIEYCRGGKDELSCEQINGVVVCTFKSRNRRRNFYIGTDGISPKLAEQMASLIENFAAVYVNSSVLLVVQQPSWWFVAERLQGNQIIFDCMDLHSGFLNIDPMNKILEKELDLASDQIVVTSEFLEVKKRNELADLKPLRVIRNGVDTRLFDYPPNQERRDVVGYFGAIAEWFDIEILEHLAIVNPQVKFQIIGQVSNFEVRNRLQVYKNIDFLGEVPNNQLPLLVAEWSVGLIPFKLSPLILATNPVKMYEYAALGIPTVATDIPEVKLVSANVKGIFASRDFDEFNANLRSALHLNGEDLDQLRIWGEGQDWSLRARELVEHSKILPKVSIIVLMWNQGLMTLKCLQSILERSDYANLEIILVDNNSELAESLVVTRWLESVSFDNIQYIRNAENLGFAGGNNVGLTRATGDFLVILNNDTEVSPGWIWRSLKHFYRNDKLGLLGPSTNNCGNEARVKLRGKPSEWLNEVVPRFNFRKSSLMNANTVAFFCVFIPRKVFNEVGLISLEYGRGYFEDDDYCRRVQALGFDIGIARDVFVHHKMGASFDMLGDSQRIKLFNENKAKYEAKWGKWTPHTYAFDSDQS